MVEKYPILELFILNVDEFKKDKVLFPDFSSKLINDYLREDFANYKEPMTSYFFNKLLNKLLICK